MKIKTRKWLLAVLIALFAIVCFAIPILKPKTKAMAAQNTDIVFAMKDGASVRLTSDGLRFQVCMNKETRDNIVENDNVSLHFLIAPASYFAGVTGDYVTNITSKLTVDVDESLIYYNDEDGLYYANGCVYNVLEANRTLEFNAVAYTYTAGAAQPYAYAEMGDTVRSQYYVLNAATTDIEEDYTSKIFDTYSWYGSDRYPIEVDTDEAYQALVEDSANGVDFSGKRLTVAPSVTASGEINGATVVDYDYELSYESGGAYYNETLTAIDFGSEYANQTVYFKMDVCGTAPTEGTAKLGFVASDKSWYQLVIDREKLSTLGGWSTITGSWTLDAEGKMWTSAICWDDNSRPSYSMYIKDVEVLEYDYVANYTNVESYWSSGYGDSITIEFGSAYANQTVAVSMEVCGTASTELYKADGTTSIKVGLSNSDKSWYSYEIDRSAVSTVNEWTQVTFVWTLDENGNYTTSAFSWYDDIANAYEYRESYQIFIRNAQVYADYVLSYESSGAYYTDAQTAIDFGAEYANQTVYFKMDVCGTASAEGTALLGFMNSEKTWYQLVIDREKLSTTETWSTITGSWTLDDEGKMWTSAICWDDNNRPSYSIYIKNAEVLEYDYVANYTNVESYWSSTYGDLVTIEFGSEYANKTVAVSMEVCGTASKELYQADGVTPIRIGLSSGGTWFSYEIDRSAISTVDEWTKVVFNWTLDENGNYTTSAFSWYDAIGNAYEYRESYQIFIRNAEVFSDYVLSYESSGAYYTDAQTAIDFGSEYANQTVYFKMDVCGTAPAEGTAKLGFMASDKGWYQLVIDREKLSTTEEWSTITGSWTLDAEGKMWTSAICWDDNNRPSYSIYIKDVEVLEYDYVANYTNVENYWSSPFGDLITIELGSQYANQTVTLTMDVCGNASAELYKADGTTPIKVGLTNSDKTWFSYEIDRSAISTADTWTTITLENVTLNADGNFTTAAFCWYDDIGNAYEYRESYQIFIKNARVDLNEDYELHYESGGAYYNETLTAIDFGAEYANKTVEFSMEVCGNAPVEGDALLGFVASDKSWYQLVIDREKLTTPGVWSTISGTWKLDAEGKMWTSAICWNDYDRPSYSIYIKNVVVTAAYDYVLSYESSGAYFTDAQTAIDFGAEYANQTVYFKMDVCGTAPAEGTAKLGFMASDKGWYQLVIDREKLSTTEEWSTITGSWTLDAEGKMWTSAICWDDNSRPSYSIYIKDVEVLEYDYVANYTNVESYWSSAYGDLVTIEFGSEYANKTVAVSMEVCGTASKELYQADGVTPIRIGLSSGGTWFSYEIDRSAISTVDEWTKVVFNWTLDENGNYTTSAFSWYDAIGNAYEYRESYQIFIRNARIFSDYVLSYESGGDYYNTTLTAIDFGVEYANKTVAFTMDVCGNAPAEGNALLGFMASDKSWYQLVIDREKLTTPGVWNTITGSWKLDSEGKMWTSAICWSDNERPSYSIYIKNAKVFSEYATTYYGNQGDVWAWTNASPDLMVSFGSEYANKTVDIIMDVCGTANPEWTEALLGFAQYNNGSKYWWSWAIDVTAISTTTEWTTITLNGVPLDSNGNWATSPMYKIGDGQSDTSVGYTIYMRNVEIFEYDYATTYHGNGGDVWAWTNASPDLTVSFGSEYANQTVDITMEVCGTADPAWTTALLGFAQYNNGSKYWWSWPIDVSAISTKTEWTAITLHSIPLDSNGNFVTSPMYKIGDGQSDTEIGYTIYIKNAEILEDAQIAEFQIVLAESEFGDTTSPVNNAAKILQAALAEAGVNISIVSDATEKGAHEIILGQTNRREIASYSTEGYSVYTTGANLVIAAEDSRGIIYGVYALLENLGFSFYNNEVIEVPSLADQVLSNINLDYEPAFEYRELVYKEAFDTEWGVSVGLNGDFGKPEIKDPAYGGYIGYVSGSGVIHTSIGTILPSTLLGGYQDDAGHPEYFAVDANGNYYAADYTQAHLTQVCLSNADALATAKTYLMWYIQGVVWGEGYDGQSVRMMVSPMDNSNYCQCTNCLAKYETYGKSGAWLMWVNELANHIKSSGLDFSSKVYIETLAYSWTRDLPLGGVVPADNVIVRFCSSMGECCVDRANCSICKSEQDLLAGWTAICNNVYVYYYSIVYTNYMAIYPNFDDLYYDINYMYQVGVKGVYVEGYLKNNGEFGELRSYLIAKMLQNPSMTIDEYHTLMNGFCNSYYGAAGQSILNYINAARGALTGCLSIEVPALENKIDFSDSFVDTMEGYWDSAESAVSSDATLLARVQKSRLHWTYSMLSNCESQYNWYNYRTAVNALASKMVELNVRCINSVTAVKTDTTYTSNPTEWSYTNADDAE